MFAVQFTFRQILVIAVATAIAILIVALGYFGSRWLHGSGSEIEVVTEYALPDGPLPTKVNRPVRASGPQDTTTDLVSDSGNESSGDSELVTDSTSIDEDLEAQLAALSDDELTALAQALEQDEAETSKYPAVPDGYPSDLKPVWFEDYFDEDLHANHVIIDRVLIELWNQGDHDFVSASYDHNNGRVYPLYPDVLYVEWDTYFYDGPDGHPIEVAYISSTLATEERGILGRDFTLDEIRSGAYKTKFPGTTLVDYDSAGYDPATFLANDY